MAEAVRPGDDLTRFGAEVTGAFVNPAGALARGVSGATRAGKRVIQSRTQAGRESAAAETLQGALREAGEDPAGIAKRLAEPDVTPGMERPTAGQTTGSPNLLAIEAKLAGRSPHFAGEARKRVDEGFASLRTAIDDLVQSGVPESLRQAAQLRERYFNELLDRRLTTALREVEQKTVGLPQRGKAQAQDARGVERRLWNAIDKKVSVPATGAGDGPRWRSARAAERRDAGRRDRAVSEARGAREAQARTEGRDAHLWRAAAVP